MKVARLFGRSCIGYEVDLEPLPIIRARVGMENASLMDNAQFEIIIRDEAKHLRTWLSEQVKRRKMVAKPIMEASDKP